MSDAWKNNPLKAGGNYERQEAGTPRDLFDVLNRQYWFDMDVCANEYNHKLPKYIDRATDSLTQSWKGMRAWCNPPFDNIPAWLGKWWEPDFAAYLLPVRTDRMWWAQYKPRAECHYFLGERPHRRVKFEPPPGVKYSANPGCNCLLLFGGEVTPGRERWRSGRTGELL